MAERLGRRRTLKDARLVYTFLVWRLDRSLTQFIQVMVELDEQVVGFCSLVDQIVTATSGRRCSSTSSAP